jgi:hypothetical protein
MTPGKLSDMVDQFNPKITIYYDGQPHDVVWFLNTFYAQELANIDKMVLPFSTGEVEKYDQMKYGIGIDKFVNFGRFIPKTHVPVISELIPSDDVMFKFEYVGSKIIGYKENHLLEPWYEPWDDNQDGQFDTVYYPEYSNTFILITRLSYLSANLAPQLVLMYEVEPKAFVFLPSIAYTYRNWEFEIDYFNTSANNYSGTLGMMDQRDELSIMVTYSF